MKSTIDLHCDLLGCVDMNPMMTFDSPEVNCSVPQLVRGNVSLQTLAVAGLTGVGSSRHAYKQMHLYEQLLEREEIAPFRSWSQESDKLHFILAIENASVICEEDEAIEEAFSRCEMLESKEEVLYLSLTWNHENRFGGGNATRVGLKPDGKALLDFLSGQHIAIDLSHTSDQLAYDILTYIDQCSLDLIPIASHSNFRSVYNHERNLPDEFAQEIATRGGVIGLNFVRRFVGDQTRDFFNQIEHAIHIKCEGALSLGADFYGGLDAIDCPGRTFPTFQSKYSNSSCYPYFIERVKEVFGDEVSQAIDHKNAERFISDLKKHVLLKA